MFQKINAWLHLWLGLVSGCIVVLVSLTGCVLVFEIEIKDFTRPYLHAEIPINGKLLPPSRLHEAVAQALPDKKIYSVWYHGEGRTAHFNLNSDSLVYVNPYTAEVVALVDHEDFFEFILEGHRELWMPDPIGHQVVGWATFIFFLLLISGIILWWPKKWTASSRTKSFNIKWRASFKRVNYDLHNVLGFYSLIFTLILAFTGLMMSFAWFSNGVYWLSGREEKKPWVETFSDTTKKGTLSHLENVDKAWQKAITEWADYQSADLILGFPQKESDIISIYTNTEGYKYCTVDFDQYTLEVLPSTQIKFGEGDFADWLRRSNYALHVGVVGGLTTKVFYFLASLISASLPITGFIIWWQRGKKKKPGKKDSNKRVKKIKPVYSNKKSFSYSHPSSSAE